MIAWATIKSLKYADIFEFTTKTWHFDMARTVFTATPIQFNLAEVQPCQLTLFSPLRKNMEKLY